MASSSHFHYHQDDHQPDNEDIFEDLFEDIDDFLKENESVPRNFIDRHRRKVKICYGMIILAILQPTRTMSSRIWFPNEPTLFMRIVQRLPQKYGIFKKELMQPGGLVLSALQNVPQQFTIGLWCWS
uniref:Uncharacterized protein n=1 Tax=Brassica oleracea TaxID=3712 RepID=A0A3P6FSR0_BRAOL|nr:unnamed protein product [Brassica oleracea]